MGRHIRYRISGRFAFLLANVGVGDVDGDGKADIIWRNTTTGTVG